MNTVLRVLAALLAFFTSSQLSAGSYFYQVDEVFGARGRVVAAVEITDGRTGVIIDVGGGTLKTIPCSPSAVRLRKNATGSWFVASGPACGLDLTESCASRDLVAGGIGSELFEAANCTNGSRGLCVTVSGEIASGAYLGEEPFERPVADRLYEQQSSLCN